MLVDPLLTGDEADASVAELGGQAAVGLLGQHPQRAGVDASALLLEELECVVRLAGVRRTEVGDDGLRLGAALAAA